MSIARETVFFLSLLCSFSFCAFVARSDPQFITNVEPVTTVEDKTLIYSLEFPGSSAPTSTTKFGTGATGGLVRSGNVASTVSGNRSLQKSTTLTYGSPIHSLSSKKSPNHNSAPNGTDYGATSNWITSIEKSVTLQTSQTSTIPKYPYSNSLPPFSKTSALLSTASFEPSESWLTSSATNSTVLSGYRAIALNQSTFISTKDSLVPIASSKSSIAASSNGIVSALASSSRNASTMPDAAGGLFSGGSSIRTMTVNSKSTSPTSTRTSTMTTICQLVTSMTNSLDSSVGVSGVQTYCTCGETMTAINIATSATSTTYYCAMGEPVPTGFAQVPTKNGHIVIPPKYGAGNWSTNECSVALTGNTGYSNLQMWTEADAAGTWDYISNLPYDGSVDWSSFVARELNFSSWQEYQCQELSANNNCMYQEDCISPITPGAWMVVNSIANLWGYHWDMFNTIQTAHTQIDVDLIVNNFSPQFDEAAYLQHEIFLTGLTFGIMMGIGALFSFGAEFAVAAVDIVATAAEAAEMAAMEASFVAEGLSASEAAAKAAQAAKSATTKTLQEAGRTATILLAHDTIAGVSMFEIMTARYADGTAEDGLAAQNVLTDLIANTTNLWQTSEAGFISQLFNGSKNSIKNVGDAIVNGTWLTPWNETSSKDNFTSTSLPLIEKHLYGEMIPYAWAAATKSKNQIMPVVIMADGCLANITDLIPKADHSDPPMRFDKDVDKSKICFEGKTFWVLTPYKTGHANFGAREYGISGTDQVRFELPPGLTMLTGASDTFGGLTIQDMVISSYYGWGNNSFMNPTAKPNPASVLQQEAWSQSVQYPGFFNYPICNGLEGIIAAAQSFWDKSYIVPC